jgi:hypothetical protein
MNPIKFWLIIKDDSKRTFEVCGQTPNTNAFSNEVYAMQRLGMSVSGATPPLSGKISSKELITVTSYKKEAGLYDRLKKEFLRIRLDAAEHESEGMQE